MVARHPQSDGRGSDRWFVVCVHDICPRWSPLLVRILEHLRPLTGNVLSLAVIPEPDGQAWPVDSRSVALVEAIREHSSEVLLHGLTHRRPRSASPLSRFIGFNDEFARLDRTEAVRRVRRGRGLLCELLGHQVTGFVAPGWRAGVLPAVLATAGLDYLVEMSRILRWKGAAVRLATWSWNAGPVASAGLALGMIGSLLSLQVNAIPVVVLHPADLARGFLPMAIRKIERLLAGGRRPVIFGDLVAGRSPAADAVPAGRW